MLPEVDFIRKILIEPEDFYGHMVEKALFVVSFFVKKKKV